MEVTKTHLDGCLILQPEIFADARGYFVETYNQQTFIEKTGINTTFVQDNESLSSYGVLRGLHFQTGASAQAKLVRVVKGKVLDVAVDVRKNSPTFLQHIAIELSQDNKTQLYIPEGFAHGFAVLENNTIFNYKFNNFYNKSAEAGLHINDKKLNIDWRIKPEERIISDKDLLLPFVQFFDFDIV